MEKITYSVLKAYYGAKAKVEKVKNDESGMETLEAVLLIAIAVIIAAFIINFLTKNGDSGHGVIGDLFIGISEKIKMVLDGNKDDINDIITNTNTQNATPASANP